MNHDNDGAKPGPSLTFCGDCLRRFDAPTAQESARLAFIHIDAGCPKRRNAQKGTNKAAGATIAPAADIPLADDVEALLWG